MEINITDYDNKKHIKHHIKYIIINIYIALKACLKIQNSFVNHKKKYNFRNIVLLSVYHTYDIMVKKLY